MSYLLDANVFIRAKDAYFGFDFCPAFWDWLAIGNANGRVFSVDRAGDELKVGNDQLAQWASRRDSGFFLPSQRETGANAESVLLWLRNRNYESAGIDHFLQSADFSLVAYALAHGHNVVTHEVRSNSKRRIKIPDVCDGYGIECLTPFEMLRREGARFVLDRAA